jgi:polyhydroxyalkanoate synthesis regulator phasin
MGVFDDFRRLFWVKKAVTKSAAEKAGEKGRELGEDFADMAGDTWEKTKEVAEDIGETIVNKTREGFAEAKETASDLWAKKDDWTQKQPDTDKVKEDSQAFKTGEKIGETAAKIGDQAEKTFSKAKEEGKVILDKAVEKSDQAWEKAEEVSEDLWNKAKVAAEKAGKKIDEGVDAMLEKAKALDKKIEEETDKIDANRDGWADTTIKDKLRAQGSTLEGKDDFFEKAARFGEGDYSMGKPVVTGKDDSSTSDERTPLPPLPDDDFADDAIIDDGDDT